jgi:tripartite-type tricarboxylate transporter receptor subunit TctC
MRRIAWIAVLLAAASSWCAAQGTPEYPTRTVTIIVGFPPGTATDTVARILAERFTTRLGKSFVVDNRPGQGGSLGAGQAAKAPPDGHTLLLTATAPMATNPNLYSNLPYDPRRDFAPIGLTSWLPYALVVSSKSGPNTLKDLIDRAKAQPDKVTFASIGNGTTSHLLMLMFAQRTGIQMTHVPYKGSAQAQTEILAGRIDTTFDTMVSTMPHVKAGSFRALATSGIRRSQYAPEIPTLDEQGVTGFDGGAWLGLVAPAGTPAAIVTKMNRELNVVLNEPTVKKRLLDIGSELLTSTPDEFSVHIRTEYEKWGKLVRESGAKID